ncbi:MAG: arginine deiminase-related protein, partial [Janthinobacterium lividum]
ETAFLSLKDAQTTALEKYCRLIYSSLNTIETNGGGSARCMMAEVFLPVKIV